MKSRTKTTFKFYAAWDFDKEAEEYNRMSEKGWQLVKSGRFHQKYEFDDSVVYRYQVDYNNDIDDVNLYDATFREMGWEQITITYNDWHIFRKKYDPSLSDEEYEIYTDSESRIKMLNRWKNTWIFATSLLVLFAINSFENLLYETYSLADLIEFVVFYGIIFAADISAFKGINNVIKGKKNKHRFKLGLFLMLILLSDIIWLIASFIGSMDIYYPLGMLCGFGLVGLIFGIKSLVSRRKERK